MRPDHQQQVLMFFRRTLLALATLGAMAPRFAHAQTDVAADFIKTNGNRILTLAAGAENDTSKQAELLAAVETAVDVDGIGRFALGPYARQATPEQMTKYLQLFHKVISNGVTARLSAYQNATFTEGRTEQRGSDYLVHTVIGRPGSPDADVDWVVGEATGGMRILDVIAEGTSLRQTERSDYTSYLQNHGGSIDALIQGVSHQVSG